MPPMSRGSPVGRDARPGLVLPGGMDRVDTSFGPTVTVFLTMSAAVIDVLDP